MFSEKGEIALWLVVALVTVGAFFLVCFFVYKRKTTRTIRPPVPVHQKDTGIGPHVQGPIEDKGFGRRPEIDPSFIPEPTLLPESSGICYDLEAGIDNPATQDRNQNAYEQSAALTPQSGDSRDNEVRTVVAEPIERGYPTSTSPDTVTPRRKTYPVVGPRSISPYTATPFRRSDPVVELRPIRFPDTAAHPRRSDPAGPLLADESIMKSSHSLLKPDDSVLKSSHSLPENF